MEKMTRRCLRLRLRISISFWGEKFFLSFIFFFPSAFPHFGESIRGNIFNWKSERKSNITLHYVFHIFFSNQLFNEKRLDTHHLLFSITNGSKCNYHTKFSIMETSICVETKLKKVTELILMSSRWTRPLFYFSLKWNPFPMDLISKRKRKKQLSPWVNCAFVTMKWAFSSLSQFIFNPFRWNSRDV